MKGPTKNFFLEVHMSAAIAEFMFLAGSLAYLSKEIGENGGDPSEDEHIRKCVIALALNHNENKAKISEFLDHLGGAVTRVAALIDRDNVADVTPEDLERIDVISEKMRRQAHRN